MTEDVKHDEFAQVELNRYRAQVPRELWGILLPAEGDNKDEFAISLKRLRIREQERNYVMSIQRKFGIAIRPNETVKESMTRVRLKRINDSSGRSNRHLPLDPLE